MNGYIQEVQAIIARETCPPLVRMPICKRCSYYDFCYATENENKSLKLDPSKLIIMEHKITVKTEDPQIIERILQMIKDEPATYTLVNESKKNSNDLVNIMNNIAEKKIIQRIQDPLKWQKEIRKDKKLIGRR